MIRHEIAIRNRGRTLVAIDGFRVPESEITFLLGESGIGKSMLAKAVYGLLDPEEFAVTIDSAEYRAYCAAESVKALQKNSFFVFQEPSSHLNPLMKIDDQLNEGSLAHGSEDADILRYLWQTTNPDDIRHILDIYPRPYRPSGGEKQRVLLAMAFRKIQALKNAGDTARTFFVFDEPTGNLDNHYRNLFLRLLFQKYQQQPFTALIITHDYSIISELYRSHAPLLPRIHFSELVRDGASEQHRRVTLRDFSAQRYLSWLAGQRPDPIGEGARDAVLRVEPRFSVFGRHRRIYRDVRANAGAPLCIHRGEMAYLKAGSGVGKTTLAKIIMGLTRADSVNFTLCDIAANDRSPRSLWRKRIWGRRASMVFQHADEALDLMCTVRETFKGLPGDGPRSDDEIESHLRELFDTVTPQFLAAIVGSLSGGQKQRLNLLRTLALDTDLIILDEPLNGLDFDSARRVLSMLERKRAQGAAMLMISHNEEIIENIVSSDSIYYMD